MRRLLAAAAMVLGLAACYQVEAPVVPDGMRVPGISDGRWRQADGTEVALAWDDQARAYRVGAGGVVRLKAAANGLYLADYQAERRIALLVRPTERELVFLVLPESAEKGAAASFGAAIRPGPIKQLSGEAKAVAATLEAMATRPDLVEAGRLTRVGP